MKRLGNIAAMVLLAVTVAAAQYGHGPHGPGGPGGPGGPNLAEHLTKMLDLSADQKVKVETIVSKYMDGTLGEKMKSMHEARQTLAQTIHDFDATDGQVRQAAGVVSGIDSQIALEQHHMAVEVSKLLTADQRAKFEQIVKEHVDHDGPPPPQGGGGF